MKKAYLISIKMTKLAEVYVLANSEEEAVSMVTEDTQCIEDFDFDDDTPDIYCVDEDELEDLSPDQPIYNYDLEKTTVDEIMEGGDEWDE